MKQTSIFYDHAARGANDGWRYVVTWVLAPVLFIVSMVVVVLALMLARLWPADYATRFQDPGRPVDFFGFNGLLFLALLLAFVVVIRLIHRKRFGDIIGAWTWRGYGLGFGVWTAVLVVGVLVDLIAAPKGFHFSANRDTPMLAATACVALLAQTFAEEFVFRGYLTQGLFLATRRRALPTALISGLLFGALHIPNGAPQAANATCLGVVLALIAMRTGGIAFTSGLHLANNLFGAVVVVSSSDVFHSSPGLFTQDTPQLMWWDAGVGVAALVALAIAVHRFDGPAGRTAEASVKSTS